MGQSKNIRIDYRLATGDPTLFRTYAAELVGLSPNAILASTTSAVAGLREQTRTIPIVFASVSDPVGQGFVQSLARPGGNTTGFSAYDALLIGKWLQLLKEVAPNVTRVAVIFNPDTQPYATFFTRAIEAAAPSFGMVITLAPVHDDAAIEDAIAAEASASGGGLIALPDSFNTTHRDAIHRCRSPSQFAPNGCGRSISSGRRPDVLLVRPSRPIRAGGVLHRPHPPGSQSGRPPGTAADEIPLIINLNTAKKLGLTVPERVLDVADEGDRIALGDVGSRER